jgi:hypothetical protein
MLQTTSIPTTRETKIRREAITNCELCSNLRESDEAFQREYDENDCESILPSFERNVDGFTNSHSTACKLGQISKAMVDNIRSRQREVMRSCKLRNAGETSSLLSRIARKLVKKGYPKSVAKSIVPADDTIHPDNNIELTRAKVDTTADDDSVIVVETDEPPYTPEAEEDTAEVIDIGPSPRTEKIVVGNRYVEVPAYSEDAGIDAGRVIKAGAAAAVVGTAAVATGVVAAKVLDYAEENKGAITKGASGAAAALKQRLKDRLSSGGFDTVTNNVKDKIKDSVTGNGMSKAASGAAEALKEKLKNRLASGGGVTKAMSGATQALKYKLKERAASGGLVRKAASGFKEKVKTKLTGGGLMKGMAKASGGLMRGLFRR